MVSTLRISVIMWRKLLIDIECRKLVHPDGLIKMYLYVMHTKTIDIVQLMLYGGGLCGWMLIKEPTLWKIWTVDCENCLKLIIKFYFVNLINKFFNNIQTKKFGSSTQVSTYEWNSSKTWNKISKIICIF
jgi:hypothetical protein